MNIRLQVMIPFHKCVKLQLFENTTYSQNHVMQGIPYQIFIPTNIGSPVIHSQLIH